VSGGWTSFSGLGAGSAVDGLNLGFTAASLGLVEDTIAFNGFGYNASDPEGLAQARTLLIRANVVGDGGGGTVPEPGTLALIVLGLVAAARSARRRPRGVTGR
jgi:hypothetical protein